MDPVDIINLIPAQWHAYLLLAITATTLAMPLLEWVANKTANTWDNALVARIAQVLALVPRLRHGNTQKAAATVARTSKMPPPIAIVLLALCMLPLAACTAKHAKDVKNIARRVNDIATELCESTMGADAAMLGLSVRELCMLPYVIGPFLQAPRLAAANAKAGATVVECGP